MVKLSLLASAITEETRRYARKESIYCNYFRFLDEIIEFAKKLDPESTNETELNAHLKPLRDDVNKLIKNLQENKFFILVKTDHIDQLLNYFDEIDNILTIDTYHIRKDDDDDDSEIIGVQFRTGSLAANLPELSIVYNEEPNLVYIEVRIEYKIVYKYSMKQQNVDPDAAIQDAIANSESYLPNIIYEKKYYNTVNENGMIIKMNPLNKKLSKQELDSETIERERRKFVELVKIAAYAKEWTYVLLDYDLNVIERE